GLGLIFLIFIVFRLKPKFNIDKSLFKAVLNENSTNGRPIYYGSLAGVATTNIAGFTISYFLNNTQVGFYTLAMTVCSPLLIVPSVLGTTFFKKFATSEFIPKKVFLFSIIATIIALLIFFLFIEKVFLLFYSKDYFPVINIAKVLIFGFMLHGYGDLINRFLGARGKGKILRNVAFMVGFVNILGYLILVKYFGVMGAIITSIVASGLYLLMMYYYYLKFTKKYKYV